MPRIRCRWFGCTILLRQAGYCSDHAQQVDRQHNSTRGWYRSPAWRRLRTACLDRDRHSCQAPGCYSARRLHVHHIKPRPADTPTRTPQDKLSNLITLCDSCHAQLEAAIRADRSTPLRTHVEGAA